MSNNNIQFHIQSVFRAFSFKFVLAHDLRKLMICLSEINVDEVNLMSSYVTENSTRACCQAKGSHQSSDRGREAIPRERVGSWSSEACGGDETSSEAVG